MSTQAISPRRRSGLDRGLTAVENLAAGLSLVGAVTVALLAIILRELFDVYLFWSEEVIIYLVISSTFFGSVLTLRSNEHVNVDIVSVFLGRRGKRVMAIIAAVVTMLYLLGIGILAWMLLVEPFSRSTVTPALKLPLWVVELPIALALTLMFLHSLDKIRHAWRHGAKEASAADVALAQGQAAGFSAEDIGAARRSGGLDPEPAPHVPGDPLRYLPPNTRGTPGHRNTGSDSGPSPDHDGGTPPAGKGEPR